MKTIFAAILFLAICAGIVHADLSLPILRSGWTTTTDPGQALNALGLGSNAVVVVDSGVAVPGDSYTELYVQQNGNSQNLLRDDLTTDGMNNYGDIQIYTPGNSVPFLSAAVANSDAYPAIIGTDPDTSKNFLYVDTPNQSTTISEPTIGGDMISGWNNGTGQSSVGIFDASQQGFGEEQASFSITNLDGGPITANGSTGPILYLPTMQVLGDQYGAQNQFYGNGIQGPIFNEYSSSAPPDAPDRFTLATALNADVLFASTNEFSMEFNNAAHPTIIDFEYPNGITVDDASGNIVLSIQQNSFNLGPSSQQNAFSFSGNTFTLDQIDGTTIAQLSTNQANFGTASISSDGNLFNTDGSGNVTAVSLDVGILNGQTNEVNYVIIANGNPQDANDYLNVNGGGGIDADGNVWGRSLGFGSANYPPSSDTYQFGYSTNNGHVGYEQDWTANQAIGLDMLGSNFDLTNTTETTFGDGYGAIIALSKTNNGEIDITAPNGAKFFGGQIFGNGGGLTNFPSSVLTTNNYRAGTVSIASLATSTTVTFTIPMPASVGTNYVVTLAPSGFSTFPSAMWSAKTTNGFTAGTVAVTGGGLIDYTAFPKN